VSSFFFNATVRCSRSVGLTVDPVRVPGVPDSTRAAGVAGVPDDDDDDDELALELEEEEEEYFGCWASPTLPPPNICVVV